MTMRHILILLLLSLNFNGVLAGTPVAPEFLVQSQKPLPTAEHESLVFNYNSKSLDGSLLNNFSKEELIKMIKTNTSPEIAKGVKRKGFSIPFGPHVNWDLLNDLNTPEEKKNPFNVIADFKQMKKEISKETAETISANLEHLSEADLRTFLSKKYSFLNAIGSGIENVFQKLKLKPPYRLIQGLINSLNTVFYQKSEQFVRSNTVGVPIFVSAGIGTTFGRVLYNCLIAKTPLKKFINPNFGFYFSSAIGFSVAKIQSAEKSAWVVDLFFDFETLKRAFLPMFEVSAGGGYGFFMENRKMPEDKARFLLTKGLYNHGMSMPVIGSIRTGPSALSNQHSIIVGLPLATTLYETNVSRRSLTIVVKRSKNKLSCEQFYSL